MCQRFQESSRARHSKELRVESKGSSGHPRLISASMSACFDFLLASILSTRISSLWLPSLYAAYAHSFNGLYVSSTH